MDEEWEMCICIAINAPELKPEMENWIECARWNRINSIIVYLCLVGDLFTIFN